MLLYFSAWSRDVSLKMTHLRQRTRSKSVSIEHIVDAARCFPPLPIAADTKKRYTAVKSVTLKNVSEEARSRTEGRTGMKMQQTTTRTTMTGSRKPNGNFGVNLFTKASMTWKNRPTMPRNYCQNPQNPQKQICLTR